MASNVPSWLLLLTAMSLISITIGDQTQYSYFDQSSWPELCQSGEQQSPIDIDLIEDTVLHSSSLPDLGEVQLTYTNSSSIKYGVKDGPLVVMPEDWPVGHTDGLQLLQIHFHWGSNSSNGAEHNLYGKQFQGEMHLVTRNLDQLDPLSDDFYAVFGVFLEEDSSQVGSEQNEVIKNLVSGGVINNEVTVPLSQLFSMETTSVYTYEGSLTTPGCAEHVFWMVFEEPIKLTPGVMGTMRQHHNVNRTFRNPQPLNGRPITHRVLGEQLTSAPLDNLELAEGEEPVVEEEPVVGEEPADSNEGGEEVEKKNEEVNEEESEPNSSNIVSVEMVFLVLSICKLLFL
ncbi:putative carbonic anhydrase 3 [Bolinopsis microptera]|uniref:putative carbonic anhydrase 3 n=1 Tax=Bolinopsis microptera TaxID=2820187 RepID=UPI003078E5FB